MKLMQLKSLNYSRPGKKPPPQKKSLIPDHISELRKFSLKFYFVKTARIARQKTKILSKILFYYFRGIN